MLTWCAALLAQLYYINADPLPNISQSVGTYVDEGLNTCQARNFVNYGKWGFTECDNLVKSPLYNAYLVSVFKVFGTTRTVARLGILVPSALILFLVILLFNKPVLGIGLVLTYQLQVHIFQYQHLAMVESLVNALALFLVYLIWRSCTSKPKQPSYFFIFSVLFSFLLFLMKVQYAYLLALPFLVGFFNIVFLRERRTFWIKITLVGGGFLAVLMLLFYTFWVVPNQEFIEMLRVQQGSNRFAELQYAFITLKENGSLLLWKNHLLFFQLAFVFTLVSLPFSLRGATNAYKVLLLVSSAWLLLELHKVFILWLPTRYALSLLTAQAWFMVLVFSQLLKNKAKIIGGLSLAVILLIGGVHVTDLYQFSKKATWQSQTIINDVAEIDFKGRKAIGVWSTALVWNNSAYLLPVWKGFLNDTINLLDTHNPRILMGHELDISAQGIFPAEALQLYSKSKVVKTYPYEPFEIKVFQFP